MHNAAYPVMEIVDLSLNIPINNDIHKEWMRIQLNQEKFKHKIQFIFSMDFEQNHQNFWPCLFLIKFCPASNI